MAAASSTPALPPTFYTDFGITDPAQLIRFNLAFDVQSDGTFQLKPGWSLQFTHAVLTTGDRAQTIARVTPTGPPLHTGSAGDLWKKCTGHSVRDEPCCVYNCPNPDCDQSTGKPKKAGATAHVYATFQTPQHDIRFMILLPTCSYDNHAGQTAKSKTNFPLTGEEAYMLCTVNGARMIFIEINPNTEANKGQGKGGPSREIAPPGQGGTYKGFYGRGSPPGVQLI